MIASNKEISLKKYKGKKVYLIINVACKCTLTAANYVELVKLYEIYQSQGL